MRKFAAHYLLTDNGLLLKNGMVVVEENGTLQFIDTKSEVVEMEQMIFHSGLLMGAIEFIKKDVSIAKPTQTENLHPLFTSIFNKDHLSIKEVIDLAKHIQNDFPQMIVPEILLELEQILRLGSFTKITVAGLYLLSGLDLGNLHFTPATRLKKIV